MSAIMDQDVGYTQFPDLNPEERDVSEVTTIPWGTDGTGIPLDTLTLSWAALLRSFTGEEYPTFILDGVPVQADLTERSFNPIRPEVLMQEGGGYCGIFTNGNLECDEDLLLAVTYDLNDGTGTLRSTLGISPSYLIQIGCQLKHFIRYQLDRAGLQITLPDEDAFLLSTLNPDPQILPGAQLLHQLVSTKERNSNAIEFLNDNGTRNQLSYEALDRLSTRFASRLVAALGASQRQHPDDVIPILLPQSTNLYIALLAILKAGAAFCPLNLDAPLERIAFIVNDVAARVVVTTAALAGRFQDVNQAITIISIDDDIEGLQKAEDGPSNPREPSPDSLAYVMYTSGSTGLPKGVGVSHRAATQSLLAHDGLIPLFTRFLQFAATTFDVSVFEIFFPLFRGATLVGCDRGIMLNDLAGIMRKLEVDASELTPTVATELLRNRQAVPSLQVLLTIGEMLTRHVVREFGSSPRNEGLLHGMYGPTEAAIHCTMASNFKANLKVGIIGSPLPSVSAHVVAIDPHKAQPDDELEVLPLGHIGELAVGGHQLASFYINRPEENAKAFVSTRRYGRVYRTGDRARFLPSGDIEILGRISGGQVKLRGQRLELGEIEHIVCKADEVRNAVASVINDILVVFVLVDNNSYSQEEIHEICRRWLPKFMIPGDFVYLTELPRSPSGKIDKKELERNYVLQKRGGANEAQRFTDASENKIAACIGETLSTPINSSTSLSAAGLDSLTAIRLSTRLRAIGVELNVVQILEADTVREVWLAANRGDGLETPSYSISGGPGNEWSAVSQAGFTQLQATGWISEAEAVIPCSPTQVSMLSESVKNPKAYFNRIELEFSEDIKESEIKNAFCVLAEHNEILRSSFIEIDLDGHSYAQVIWKSLPEACFSNHSKRSSETSNNQDGKFVRPFSIQLDGSREKVKATVRLHHALYDGWSWELILMDIQEILTGQSIKPRPQYRILTEFYQKHTNSEYLDFLADYWQDQLQDASPTLWPNFNDRLDVPAETSVSRRGFDITLSDIDSVSRNLRVGRQTIFQAAFAYILNTYAGSDDIVFGSVSSGRTLAVEGIEDIIGPCINTLPMKLNIANSRNVRDLLAVVHNLNRNFIKYGALPLGDIKKASGVDPTRPLFDSLFIWQETLLSSSVSPRSVSEISAEEFLEFTMTLEIELTGERLVAKATYLQSILPSTQVDIFLDQIEQVALLFMRFPDLLLTEINSNLTDSVLSIENEIYEKQRELPSLASGVEMIAKEDPERISIEFIHGLDLEADKLTYRQLNNQANQVAHYLLDHGVGDNCIVGILLEKSIDFYVSVLAVIKAGTGYVPIPPDTPIDFVRTILDEAQCGICITSSSLSHLVGAPRPLRILKLDSDNLVCFPEHNVVKGFQNRLPTRAVFTAGRTEETDGPEGVTVTYHSIQSNISELSGIYPISPTSKWLQACSRTLSGSVFDIFFPWQSGMTLCSTPDEILHEDIEQVIRTMGVTHLNLVPTVASLVNPNNVPNVKFLSTTGEELSPKVFKDWAGRGLYQGYVPNGLSNICALKPKLGATNSIRNIGQPLPNTSAFVVSSSEPFSLAPKGAIGELYFGGDQLDHKYLNHPESVRTKFIDHPKYGRLYNSGDLGRLLSDGSLVFGGLRDDQPKLHGQHIDFYEIGSALLNNTEVKDCITMIIKDYHSDQRQLVSFWVPNGVTNDTKYIDCNRKTIISLFDEISVALPDYMIPSWIIPIKSIPLKRSGKADKRKLIEDFRRHAQGDLQIYSRPSEITEVKEQFSDIERIITRVLANITHAQPTDIQRNSSFFSFGLNSISAITLARRLRREGFDKVDIASIMRHSSVSRLANMISRARASDKSASESSIELERVFSNEFVEQTKQNAKEFNKVVQRVMPCTSLQEAMLSRQASTHSAYYNHLTFEILGDVDKLHGAWSAVQARHDILRTCFITTENARFAFAQIVLEDIELPWKYVNASVEDTEAMVETQKSETAVSGNAYDLPFALTAFTSDGTGRNLLLLSIHHALYDGEAMSQLLKDVEDLYFGLPLSSVVPFDAFLQKMVATDQEEADQFWDTYLDEHPTTSLVTSLWGPRRQNKPNAYRSERLVTNFSLAWVETECKRMSTTILGLFQTAWAKLLAVYAGQSDVCFGNVFSCRTLDIDGAERIVGPCFNTLPVRAKFSENSTNLDIIKNLQKSNADILSHQLSSLRRIQQRSTTNGSRPFDTLVLLQSSPRPLNDNLWELVRDEGDMDFPIVCEIIPGQRTEQIQVYLHFDGSHVPARDIGVVMKNYVHLIGEILEFPSARAADPNALGDRTLKPLRVEKEMQDMVVSKLSQKPNDITQTPVWSTEEIELVKLLAGLSGVDRTHIDPETTIFQLGLDSINAVQIAARLRERGFMVSSEDILETPSVRGLASFLQNNSAQSSSQPESFDFLSFERKHWPSLHGLLDVPESAVESLRPCTPVQAGMVAMFCHSGGDMYFNHMVLKIPSPVRLSSLKDAWTAVSEQHEMLRTGFTQIQDEKSPFGMITYRKGTFELPWSEIPSTIGNTNLLSQERDRLSKEVLTHMHRPPWHLTFQNCESYIALQFSALHAIFDAQALELILSDVSHAYRGEVTRDPIPVASVLDPILSSGLGETDELEKFWGNLGKEFQVTKFPDLSPVHTQKRFEVLAKSCSMPANSIDEGCRGSGITLTAAGQLSWARILAAYTGARDVTYGLVLSGRNISEEAQNVVFPCLTTVPAPCKVEGSNSEALKRIMAANVSLAKHQFTSLSKIHRWSDSDRGLFDTIFVHQKLSSSSVHSGWEMLDEEAKVEYPISIELVPKPDTVDFVLTFRTDILPREQAGLLLKQLDYILIDSIFSPESDSTNFSPPNPNLLSIAPANEAKIQSPINLLHQFVEVQAARNPSKTALEFISDVSEKGVTKKTWTYQQFNEEGNRYARLLQSQGASPGSLIGICFDKCPEAYFSILAILKAGCAYVALDPTAPISRKHFIVEDSGCKIVLCTSVHSEELKGLAGTVTLAADTPGILEIFSGLSPSLERPVRSDDTSYCLYTSGTTGTPKGCEITHENAVQAMLAFQRIFDGHWDEHSRWLQFASFHFDVSVLEQYWSWGVGICVTSCPRDVLFSDLAGVIHQLEITHIDLTPSLARLISPREVPSLCRGVFITGGEQLKQEILDTWGDSQVIYNGYGPTEATIGCTMLPRMSRNGKPSNIGPQFDNVGSYVFKPHSDLPVLRGCAGELCVSGPLVGRGYLNRPELTEEKFQRLEKYGERVYRTGDLVRILHDGSFSFLGRIDDQVKLRGQRLEVGEINEIVRLSSSTIKDVFTSVLKHPRQSKEQLVSFIVSSQLSRDSPPEKVWSNGEARLLVSQVKIACSTRLPVYMVPTHIIPMSGFPLSPNNKIDFRKLKDMYESMSLETLQNLSSLDSNQNHERSATMETIASCLSKFSGCSAGDIEPGSNIFALGLDSISVISFAKSLREAGFVSSEPSVIMKNPQISELSTALERTNSEDISRRTQQEAKQNIAAFVHSHRVSISRELGASLDAIEGIAPCTPLQEGMIYRALESQGQLYRSSFRFELAPSINISTLKASWASAQSLVGVLRTHFVLTGDGYAQVVMKNDSLPWFDCATSNDLEVEQIINDRSKKLREHTSTRFSEDLWNIGVIRSAGRIFMSLNLFHALFDGNSLPLLLRRVALIYTGKTDDLKAPSFLEALPLGLLSKNPKAEEFWIDHLRGLNYRRIPFISDPHNNNPTVSELDIPGLGRLENVRRRLNVTEQSIFHACWLLTLQQHFGFIPTIGVVVSGRTLDVEDAENVIGPMFNTIPCQVRRQGLSTLSGLIKSCHSYYASALPFQHTPLRDITKWIGRSPDQPLFDSLFAFQRDNEGAMQVTEQLWSSESSHSEPDYPLAFEATRRREGFFTVSIVAQPRVMDMQTADTVLGQVRETLFNIAQDPNQEMPASDDTESDSKIQEIHENENGHVVFNEQEAKRPSRFEWTPDATRIRVEISLLAGVEGNSIHENSSILEVGLDSIDAIKLSSRLNKAGIGLSVSTIMHCRTIERMMNEIVTSPQHRDESGKKPIDQLEEEIRGSLQKEGMGLIDIDRVLPATPLQEAMVAEMISSGYTRYFNHEVVEIDEHVDLERLKLAWQTVINAHPILRTSFIEISDPNLPIAYAQAVHSPESLNWKVTHAEESAIDALITEERRLQATSHSTCTPLLRLQLIIDGNRRFLLLSVAHALYDGWSLGLLHQDVAACYAGKSCNRPSYHGILESILNSSGTNAVDFWKGFLAGIQPANFPEQSEARQDHIEVHQEEVKTSFPLPDINQFCKKQGVTIQALGLTCWALVLAGYLGKLDVVFGVVLSGRGVENGDQIMFPTMNTVAMRAILHSSRSQMLKYVQETIVKISEHQHYPLRKAKFESGIGGQALFDTLFIYQKTSNEGVRPEKPLYKSFGGSSDVEYPVCVEMEGVDENLVLRLACKDNILGASDTAKLLERIQEVLYAIIYQPNAPAVEFGDGRASICGAAIHQQADETEKGSQHDETKAILDTNWSVQERSIREILSAVSKIPEDEITKNMSLFHLGLDSISAIKVSSLLKKQSITLSVSDMLRAGTISNMARAIGPDRTGPRPNDINSILGGLFEGIDTTRLLQTHGLRSDNVEKVIPATAGQIYLLSMSSVVDEHIFFPDFFYHVEGKLSHGRLEEAWNEVVASLPILRTAFIPTGQRQLPFVQAVLKKVENPIVWSGDELSWQRAQPEISSVSVRLYAYQTPEQLIIKLQIHHAMYDAVCLPKIIETLAGLCNDLKLHISSKVDTSELVAFNFLRSPVESRRHFWEEYLSGVQEDDIPPRPSLPRQDMIRCYKPGLVDHIDKIEEKARHHGLSVQALFLAAYAKLHPRFVSSPNGEGNVTPESIVIGVYLANRSHSLEGLPDLIAPSLNIVPLRIKNPLGEPILELARCIQADLHEIGRVENSCVSLLEIADWTGIKLDTFTNFIKLPDSEVELGLGTTQCQEESITFVPLEASEVEKYTQKNAETIEPQQSSQRTGLGQKEGEEEAIGRSHTHAPPALTQSGSNPYDDVFKPSIDVEAAIRDNRLDVGIFGPGDRIDESIAMDILDALRLEIVDFL